MSDSRLQKVDAEPFAEVEQVLDELRAGRMAIIVDHEDRENEGDLVCAAEHVTPEIVNFMAMHGRGLICMPMTAKRLDTLQVPLMVQQNTARRGTAFCVSIEARHDITTGISAADRAKTIRIAVDPNSRPGDLASPGHVFPLRAAPGGVLRRAGHTEASIDLCRMAGLTEAAVICEIMNEDGTMARREQLERFARRHDLAMLSIAQLIRHRMAHERLVQRIATHEIDTAMGRCLVHAFTSDLENVVHLAIVRGTLEPAGPVLVRVHPADPLEDLFAQRGLSDLDRAMERIRREGSGVVLYLQHGKASWERLVGRGGAQGQDEEHPVRHAEESGVGHRDHGVGAQILFDLGIRRLRLLTNSDLKYVALDGYGLELVERVPLDADAAKEKLMFDSLSERLQGVFKKLGGQTRITDTVLRESLREVRLALLEADVSVEVVKTLLDAVKEQALGEAVIKSLSPGQQVVKIVRDELEKLLGAGEDNALKKAGKPPTIVMMVGLQGSGKTTTTAKLGAWLKKQGRYPYLVPADIYRPAAIEQLIKIGQAAGLKVLEHDGSKQPLEIARDGLREARKSGFDTVLIDTAGRLQIDERLMDELRGLKREIEPTEILFVADAMTGQDAVKSAGGFHEALDIDGVILTKLDGDSRGGAALSIRHVSGVPIKFLGTGEKTADFEAFHPDRLVSRILGMGDVLGLIERAEDAIDEKQAAELERKIKKNEFSLSDFRDQIRMIKKMGPLSGVVSMLPGMGHVKESDLDNKALVRVAAVIDSMTPQERRLPRILNGSRKRRIARGAGQSVSEINRLLKQFSMMRRMMKQMKQGGGKGGKRGKKGGGAPQMPFFGR